MKNRVILIAILGIIAGGGASASEDVPRAGFQVENDYDKLRRRHIESGRGGEPEGHRYGRKSMLYITQGDADIMLTERFFDHNELIRDFHAAAIRGNISRMRATLQKFGEICRVASLSLALKTYFSERSTPLMAAVVHGQVEVIKFLLNLENSSEQFMAADSEGRTAYDFAKEKDEMPVRHMLLAFAGKQCKLTKSLLAAAGAGDEAGLK